MNNTIEVLTGVKKWTDAEHSRNLLASLAERKQFTRIVTGYINLLRTTFRSDNQIESIIPLVETNIDDAGLPLFTDFMRDLQADSLAVIARHDEAGYLIGLGAMKEGKYYGGLLFEPQPNGIEFIVSPTEDFSPALRRMSDRIHAEFSGFDGFQRRLRTADTMFKFIVSKTLKTVQVMLQ